MAELVTWLCSPRSRLVTGAVIPINGPWALANTFHQLKLDLVAQIRAALYQ